MNYTGLVDNLMEFYAADKYAVEAVQAKNEFYELAGIFDEQANFFELKMAQFSDWYIFSRKLKMNGLTPIQHFVQNKPVNVSDEDWSGYKNLLNSRLSLFEFLKISKNDLKVKDLFSGYKLVINNSPVTVGFSSDEYFQARLIPHGDSFVFSAGFCFHPPDAKRFIEVEIKKALKVPEAELAIQRETLLLRLFRMRHKFDQYKHVGVKEIYSNESRLRM